MSGGQELRELTQWVSWLSATLSLTSLSSPLGSSVLFWASSDFSNHAVLCFWKLRCFYKNSEVPHRDPAFCCPPPRPPSLPSHPPSPEDQRIPPWLLPPIQNVPFEGAHRQVWPGTNSLSAFWWGAYSPVRWLSQPLISPTLVKVPILLYSAHVFS